MKIYCRCGWVIPDQTDYLSYKARVIGDKNYFDYLDKVDEAIESQQEDRESLCMSVRRAFPSRTAWECNNCGRLYFYDGNHKLIEYVPQNGKANRIFDRPREEPLD